MKTPSFIVSAVIIFWTWHSGILPVSIAIIMVYEGAWIVKTRWDFSFDDFNRISDVCTLILAGLIVVVILVSPGEFFRIVFRWLPLVIFPLVIAQRYSTAGKIDIRSVMLLARKSPRYFRPARDIDITFIFILTCLIGAGMENSRNISFYWGLVVFFTWGLFAFRSKRYPVAVWAALLVLSGMTGYFSQMGLSRLQSVLTEYTLNLFVRGESDPAFQVTSLGDIGKLKQSDRILFRVYKENQENLLLQEGVYTSFSRSVWYASKSGFNPVNVSDLCDVAQTDASTKYVTVATGLNNGKGILKHPAGTIGFEGIRVGTVEGNSLGAYKIREGPGFVSYMARYTFRGCYGRLPDAMDLKVAEDEKKLISDLVDHLALRTLPHNELPGVLSNYFESEYTYSLDLEGKGQSSSWLEHFLMISKKGHCELFATATAMILRECGLPARYVTGFLVNEYSAFDDGFVVRERDAHAWVQVFINGTWAELDTTPSSWIAENQKDSVTTLISDLVSMCVFKLKQWRSRLTQEDLLFIALLLLIPLIVILWFRIKTSRGIRRVKKDTLVNTTDVIREKSGIYMIESYFESFGYKRKPYETYAVWFDRLTNSGVIKSSEREMNEALLLHTQMRFSREGISKRQHEQLNNGILEILNEWQKK